MAGYAAHRGAGKFLRRSEAKSYLPYIIALPMLVSGPALAQEAAADGAESAPEDGAIIVTAQRRAQVLGDVPISVNVASGEMLKEKHVADMKDLAAYVPSLSVADTPGANQVNIRGLGTGGRNLLFEQAVTLQVDGVTSARAEQFVAPFFDVERIEILRGPQGVLFGKNSTAGAINIVTANPADSFGASVTARYELENQGPGVEGYVTGPLGDTIQARLAFKYEREGGYLRDLNLDTENGRVDTLAVRGTLAWQPSDAFDSRLKIDYGDVDEVGGTLQMSRCTTNRMRVLTVSPTEDCRMNGTQAQNFQDGMHTKVFSASSSSNYNFSDHVLTLVAGYSQYRMRQTRELDLTPADALDRDQKQRFHQWFGEIRITSPDDRPLTYVAGITAQAQKIGIDDIQDTNVLVLPYANATSAAFHPTNNVRTFKEAGQTTRSLSPFAQLTFNATDNFRLIGGARFTTETKKIDYSVTRYNFGTFNRVVTPLDIAISDRSHQEDNFDPQISVQYDLARGLMAYATGSIVHKAGGFNVDEANGLQIARTFEYRPERAKSFEAGLKWSKGASFLNLTYFDTRFNDLQVASNDGISVAVRNAARARTRGVELDGQYRPARYVKLGGGVSYLDAKFTDYPGGACTSAAAAAVAPAPCLADLSGKRLTFAPKWSASASIDVNPPISNAVTLVAGAGINYRSSQFSQESNDPIFRIPDLTTIDAYVGIESAAGDKSLRLSVKNLTNDVVPAFLFPIRNAVGATGAITPRGRSVFLEARIDF